MGYTHHWKQAGALSPAEWDRFLDGLNKMVLTTPGLMVRQTNDFVSLNGTGPDGHEPFILNRTPRDSSEWDHCKTNRKPYDRAVVACLVFLYGTGKFHIVSDGQRDVWMPGLSFARKIWGNKKLTFPEGVRS